MTPALQRSELVDDASLSGRAFCEAYSDRIDRWLAELFDEAAAGRPGVSLVAVGGQGRRELAPQSDLDLLLLTDGSPEAAAVAEGLWYPIWDVGLKLGYAVRTARETLSLASHDIETATALLSARHLRGNANQTADLADRARAAWRKNGRRWIDELAEAVAERRKQHTPIAFALEPDLKEGTGGLRDVQALHWAAAAGAPIPPEALDQTAAPYDELLAARVELHRIQGRPGDRLLLQEQDAVAAARGVNDADELMHRVSASGATISFVAEEVWHDLRIRRGSRRGRRVADRSLGGGLVIEGGRVGFQPPTTPDNARAATLRLAVAAAGEEARLAPESLAMLRDAPMAPLPWTDDERSLFCTLLLRGTHAIDVIETLDQWGLWERLIPEWTSVRSQPQRNAYHRFTVDRHLLETAAEAAQLAHQVSRPDLLVIAALLHDIGKARGVRGDHSEDGAAIAMSIAQRMGSAAPDVELIGTLVRHHLLLPDVATRRDIDDPATVRHIAAVAGSVEAVTLLRCLTEADSIATGSTAWSSWKAELVDRLARLAAASLGDAEGLPERTPFPNAAQRALLEGSGVDAITDGNSITVCCPDRPGVFFRVAGALALHSLDVVSATIYSEAGRALDSFEVKPGPAGTIPWERVTADVVKVLEGRLALQVRMDELARNDRRYRPLGPHRIPAQVRFDNTDATTTTVVEVTGPDSTGLLYRLARSLSELDLDVIGARIATIGSDAVDSFSVTDGRGGRILDDELQSEIRRALLHALDPHT